MAMRGPKNAKTEIRIFIGGDSNPLVVEFPLERRKWGDICVTWNSGRCYYITE